jgi:biopolymer transport protein ExbB
MNVMNLLRQLCERMAEGGIYMYPIFLLSIIMFTLIVRHFFRYRMLKGALGNLHRRGMAAVPAGDSLFLLLERYRRSRCSDLELNIRLRDEMVRSFFSREGADGKAIVLCGSIAMLLGLLGTVSGMINTFESIQLFGVGNTKSFAVGISEALLTTQSGLLVGVAGLAFGHTIRRLYGKARIRLYRCFDAVENGGEAFCGAADNA